MFRSSTSSSDERRVKSLALRAALFFVPLLGGAAFLEYALYASGESWPTTKVVEAQDGLDELIVSRSCFSQQFNVLKLAIMKARSPEIVVLGSSRVMQFRSFLFHPHEASFYNGGGMIQEVADIVTYVRMVRDGNVPRPRVVIVGVDHWWFPERKRTASSWMNPEALRDEVYDATAHVTAMRTMIWYMRNDYFPWQSLVADGFLRSAGYGYPATGMLAVVKGDGFRKDGSMLHAEHIVDYLRKPGFDDRYRVAEEARNLTGWFGYPHLDSVMLGRFNDALSSLTRMGIEVYVVLAPFSNEVFEVVNNPDYDRAWWKEFTELLPEQVRAGGIPLISVTSPAHYGLTDEYMYDGVHPSEVMLSYIVADLLRQAPPGSFLSTVDLSYLGALQSRKEALPLCFFPPPTEGAGAPQETVSVDCRFRQPQCLSTAHGRDPELRTNMASSRRPEPIFVRRDGV